MTKAPHRLGGAPSSLRSAGVLLGDIPEQARVDVWAQAVADRPAGANEQLEGLVGDSVDVVVVLDRAAVGEQVVQAGGQGWRISRSMASLRVVYRFMTGLLRGVG